MKSKILFISSLLLGFMYTIFGLNHFLKFMPIPSPDPDSIASTFMFAMLTTGFLALVKILEIIGGLLIIYTKTRRLGLLILTPISINVILYSTMIAGGSMFQPIVLLILLLNGYLIFEDRKSLLSFFLKDEYVKI